MEPNSGRRWAALAVALCLLGSCEGPGSRDAEGSHGDGDTPRAGGTLVTGFIADLGGVNPYTALNTAVTQEVVTLLFLRLVEEQPDYAEQPPTMLPQLARRWEFATDRKSLTFHLRDDIRWSDGVPVTADDVRFTWQAQVSPEVAWPSANYKDDIADVEVLDPHTVRFRFSHTVANQLLRVNEGEIIPKHAWEKLPFSEWHRQADWFRQHLVVAGPFTLAAWTPQQEIVLGRNERFYQPGRPYLDRLIIRVVADNSSLLTQTLSGDLDIVFGLSVGDVARIRQVESLDLVAYWSRSYAFVAWNLRNPLFSEVEVRQALTLAIDRQAILDTVYGPYGRMATSPILSDVWAHDRSSEPWPYDPEEARRLLAEKGWKDRDGDGFLVRDGRRFAFELATNVGNQQRTDSMVMIQEQLRRIGIEAMPRLVAFNPLMERVNRGAYEAVIMRWAMPTDLDLTFAFHSDSIADGDNVFGYTDPEVDRLLEAARSSPDTETRLALLHAIQRAIHRDQPMTILYESQDLAAANRRIRGANPNALRRLWHAWEWWLAPPG
jgi:peptide/nickel transport system substrate-binding protein